MTTTRAYQQQVLSLARINLVLDVVNTTLLVTILGLVLYLA